MQFGGFSGTHELKCTNNVGMIKLVRSIEFNCAYFDIHIMSKLITWIMSYEGNNFFTTPYSSPTINDFLLICRLLRCTIQQDRKGHTIQRISFWLLGIYYDHRQVFWIKKIVNNQNFCYNKNKQYETNFRLLVISLLSERLTSVTLSRILNGGILRSTSLCKITNLR